MRYQSIFTCRGNAMKFLNFLDISKYHFLGICDEQTAVHFESRTAWLSIGRRRASQRQMLPFLAPQYDVALLSTLLVPSEPDHDSNSHPDLRAWLRNLQPLLTPGYVFRILTFGYRERCGSKHLEADIEWKSAEKKMGTCQ